MQVAAILLAVLPFAGPARADLVNGKLIGHYWVCPHQGKLSADTCFKNGLQQLRNAGCVVSPAVDFDRNNPAWSCEGENSGSSRLGATWTCSLHASRVQNCGVPGYCDKKQEPQKKPDWNLFPKGICVNPDSSKTPKWVGDPDRRAGTPN